MTSNRNPMQHFIFTTYCSSSCYLDYDVQVVNIASQNLQTITREKKSSSPSERHLTVYSKHVPRAWHQYVVMPEIRLGGKWLLDAGFECGDDVTVRCFGNKLEITLDPVSEPEPVLDRKRRSRRIEVLS